MAQLGRISGQLLKDNLTREGHDLTFDNDLLHLDVNNRRIGIKTTSPSNELQVNGTTRTTNLEVTNQADIADLTILGNTITSNNGTLNFITPDGNFVNYQAKLRVDDIDIENNVISTNASNINLELRPHGTGTVEIFADTNIYGNIYATGNIRADGDINIGDQNTDNIVINADIASNLTPNINNEYTLGNTDFRWADVWTDTLYANAIDTGDLVVDNINLNLRQGKIIYVATNGSDSYSGTHQNDPYATVKKALSEAVSGDTVFVYPGTYIEAFPLTIPQGVSVRGAGLRAVAIKPTVATKYNDAFLLNGETTVEDLTVTDFFSGGNNFTVTSAAAGTTTFNVGIAPFAHTYESGGTITISSIDYAVTNATYDYTTGVITVTHAGPDATGQVIFLSNLTFSCNGSTRIFPDNGYAFRFITGLTVTSKSPYIRNVTVITRGSTTTSGDPYGFDAGDAGKGAYIDGAYATAGSFEASMLFHSVTFITPNVDTITAKNGARVEWLNCFTYFANKGLNLISSNYGIAQQGKTQLRLDNVTGTFNVGDTLTYYDTDGTTVLATGTIAQKDADGKIYLTGKCAGFATKFDRGGKSIQAFGTAKLSQSIKKFGTASLSLSAVSDYAYVQSSTDFAFGTADFTIEFWIYRSNTTAVEGFIDCRTSNPQNAPFLYANGAALYYYVNGSNVITAAAATPTNDTWYHIAISRVSNNTRMFVNGTQVGSTWTDNTNYITSPVVIGNNYTYNAGVAGYIDDVRISKGIGRYTSNFTAPLGIVPNDSYTVLLSRFDGDDNSTTLVDETFLIQDVRSSSSGTAQFIELADYSDFGAEVRSIGSACVYGNYGVVGDGLGVVAYLIGQNLAYIGVGKRLDNDVTYVIQENEITELNGAKIYYSSVDHKGDFRVGDLFYVNQADGTVNFTTASFNIESTSGLTLTNGSNTTYIDGTRIDTGNLRLSGNTLESLTGDINITAASDQINLDNNVNISGNLDVVGDVTVAGNINLGDQPTDTVSFVAGISSNIVPTTANTYNLGSPSLYWNTLYADKLSISSIDIFDNVITTADSNADLELRAAGTGIISVPLNNVELDQNLTVNGITYLKDTNIIGTVTQSGNTTQTGNLTQTGNIVLTGSMTVSSDAQLEDIRISGNNITTTLGTDLRFAASGTGDIYVPSNDVTITQDLTVNGLFTVNAFNVTGTLTSNAFSTGDIFIDDNYITTTVGNNNLVLLAAGTGNIYVPNNDVQIDNDLTVVGLTTLGNATITGTITHIGDTVRTGDVSQTGDYSLTGNLTVGEWAQFKDIRVETNFITTTLGNNDLRLLASGTGRVYVPSNDVQIDNNLTVVGTTYTTTLTNSGTITSNAFTTGDILIDDNFITTTIGNNDLRLLAAGTGRIYIPSNDVEFDQNLTVNTVTNLQNTNITGTVTHIGNINQTGDVDQTGDYALTGNLTVGEWAQFKDVRVENNIITTTLGNNDLILEASGTGRVYVPYDNVQINNNLTVVGTTYTTTLTNSGTITSNAFSTGDILIDDNVITTTIGNNDLRLLAAGTGRIYIPNNDVELNRVLTVTAVTNLKNTFVVGTITHTGNTVKVGNTTQTGNYSVSGTLTVGNTAQFKDVKIDGNVITTTIGNNDLTLEASGTGRIYVPSNNVLINQALTVVGTTYTSNIVNSATVTSGTFTTGNISINANTIQTTVSNSNLQLRAAGTGFIELEKFEVQENEIRVSNTNDNFVITPNGTGVVYINSTQAVRLPVGTNSQRPTGLGLSDAGMLRFNSELTRYEGWDGSNWIRLDGLADSDGNTYITAELTPGANDNTIRFVTNGTQVANLTTARLSVVNIDIDNININNNVISSTGGNTNLIIQPTGSGSLRVGNFLFNGNVITNTVLDSVTEFNQTGLGYFKIQGTNGFVIPAGTNEQRPGILDTGMMRFNTTDQRVEIYDGTQWVSAAGSSGGVTTADAENIAILAAIMLG